MVKSHHQKATNKKALLHRRMLPPTNIGRKFEAVADIEEPACSPGKVEAYMMNGSEEKPGVATYYAGDLVKMRQQLRAQIEFYFSTQNLLQDKYLAKQLAVDSKKTTKVSSFGAQFNCVPLSLFTSKFTGIRNIFKSFRSSKPEEAPATEERAVPKDELFEAQVGTLDPNAPAEKQPKKRKPTKLLKKPNEVAQFKTAEEFKLYRSNARYLKMNQQEREEIRHLAQALRKSWVIKVCKDQFTIKRRLVFWPTKDEAKTIQASTLFIRLDGWTEGGQQAQVEAAARVLKDFKLKAIALKTDKVLKVITGSPALAQELKSLWQGKKSGEFWKKTKEDAAMNDDCDEVDEVDEEWAEPEETSAIVISSQAEWTALKAEKAKQAIIEEVGEPMEDEQQSTFLKVAFNKSQGDFFTRKELAAFVLDVTNKKVKARHITVLKKTSDSPIVIIRFSTALDSSLFSKRVMEYKLSKSEETNSSYATICKQAVQRIGELTPAEEKEEEGRRALQATKFKAIQKRSKDKQRAAKAKKARWRHRQKKDPKKDVEMVDKE